jgi:hypothetical protein
MANTPGPDSVLPTPTLEEIIELKADRALELALRKKSSSRL